MKSLGSLIREFINTLFLSHVWYEGTFARQIVDEITGKQKIACVDVAAAKRCSHSTPKPTALRSQSQQRVGLKTKK
ncbi:hypothetical protein ACE6H2_005454 [Prunus campanulata]